MALCNLPKPTLDSTRAGQQGQTRRRPGWSISQLTDFQLDLHARLANPELSARDAAQIARAWKELEDLRMAKIGQGKPRPVTARNDPDAKPRRKAITEAKPAE